MAQVPIKLSDVPMNVRQAAARRLMNEEPGLAQEFVIAALCPSDVTYMVDEDEARRVCGVEEVRDD